MTSLTKICLHWTAGNYKPCQQDLNSYHFLIDNNGKIYFGSHSPEDNINCYDGNYAAHCGGGNTGCIGISACAMVGFTEKLKQTKCPLTQKQIESMCCLVGYLSNKYGILITENSVFTHYEFDRKRQKPQGKIDIIYLPFLPNLQLNRIGSYLRNKAEWYKKKIKDGKYKLEKKGNTYEFVSIV